VHFPLTGIRVLDLSSVVVGPVASLRLAQYGAEVIKIESGEGDLLRRLGGASPSGQLAGAYLHLNRGKRSVRLDLKRPAAQRALQRILDRCDVFLTNLRPDALERLGLDAASVRAQRPTLVHCTITGFGPGGPYRGLPAYDSVLQGVSGIAGLFERRDGEPRYAPLLLCDHIVGEITAGAILAALAGRARNGQGASIEVPMHETMAAFVLQEHLARQTFEPPLGPAGDQRLLEPGNRPLQTADGWISVTSNTDAQTHALLRVVGRPELIDDPRFRTVADRVRNAGDWFALRERSLLGRTTAEWLAAFAAADVPAMPAHSLETLIADPHIAAVGLLQPERHPTEGAVRAIRDTILVDGVAPPLRAPAQHVGADSRDVLREAGLQGNEIEAALEG
jgi:crotonobetainyl-CoA:carnitine CoA-transferase CaiB-like acyl-CoA transferase